MCRKLCIVGRQEQNRDIFRNQWNIGDGNPHTNTIINNREVHFRKYLGIGRTGTGTPAFFPSILLTSIIPYLQLKFVFRTIISIDIDIDTPQQLKF